MSQTVQLADEYLLSAACATPPPIPPPGLVLDPQFGNIRMVTPIGRLSYANLAKPRAVQVGQEPKFTCTLLMNPAGCGDLWRAICMVANKRWPGEQRPNPQNPAEMITMTGEHMLFLTKEQGGLHNPLRQGNSTYSQDPVKYKAYLGTLTLNAGIDALNRKSGQSQQPIAINEDGVIMRPEELYSGCYGRMQVTIFAFPQPGQQIPNRGIGVLLNAVQFARHGEKLAGFDALKSAQSAFGTIQRDPSATAPQTGFGPNYGTPFTPPAGGIPAGFAQPPAQQAPAQPQAGPTFQPPGVGGGTVLPWNTPPA